MEKPTFTIPRNRGTAQHKTPKDKSAKQREVIQRKSSIIQLDVKYNAKDILRKNIMSPSPPYS